MADEGEPTTIEDSELGNIAQEENPQESEENADESADDFNPFVSGSAEVLGLPSLFQFGLGDGITPLPSLTVPEDSMAIDAPDSSATSIAGDETTHAKAPEVEEDPVDDGTSAMLVEAALSGSPPKKIPSRQASPARPPSMQPQISIAPTASTLTAASVSPTASTVSAAASLHPTPGSNLAGANVVASTPSRALQLLGRGESLVTEQQVSKILHNLSLEGLFGQVTEALTAHPAVRILLATLEPILFAANAEEASPESLRNKISKLGAEKLSLETELGSFLILLSKQSLTLLPESRAHFLENQTRAIRQDLSAAIKSEDALKQKVETLSKAVEAEKKTAEQNKERSDAHVREIASLKASLDSAEADKRNLASTIASKIEEQDSYTREIARLRSDVDTSREEIRSLNAQISEMQSKEIQIRMERATRDQENEQLKQNVAWLNDELTRKSEEFKNYRKEKSEVLSQLEIQLENTVQEKRSFETQASSQQERAESLEKRVAELTEKYQEAEKNLLSQELSFKNEMSAQITIASLHKTNSEELNAQVAELKSIVQDMEMAMDELRESRDIAVEQLKIMSEKFQSDLEEKELQVEELSSQIRAINSAALKDLKAAPGMDLISPAAHAASLLQKSGKSFTEIYSEYTKLQDELMLEKSETSRLTECLNHILNELSERAPMIQQLKEDKEAAEKEIERLTDELRKALEAGQVATSASKAVKDQIESLEAKNRMLVQESYDLGRQVQHLVFELENFRAGPAGLSSGAIEDLESDPSDTNSGRVISSRLVIFKNISELQLQNQQLRASLRKISDALEREKEHNESTLAQRLAKEMEEATTTLEGVKEQLRLANLKCESYVREREQWKRIAESRGAGSPGRSLSRPTTPNKNLGDYAGVDGGVGEFERLYRELQVFPLGGIELLSCFKRDFDNFRKETGLDTRTLKEANEALRNEKGELSIQVARLNSSLDHLNERYRTLSQSSEIQSKENVQLRERIDSLVHSLTVQDAKSQELSNHVVDVRASMDALTTECRQLRSEKELLKSVEARVMAENQGLIQQRNMANEHLKSLQRMYDDLERQGRDNVQRIEEKAVKLEKELEVVRHQLTAAQDELRSSALRREADQKEVMLKLERQASELSAALRDCEVARMEEKLSREKVEDLSSRLTAANERIKDFESQSSAVVPSAASPTDVIKELRAELTQLRSDLDLAKKSLALEQERVEQYKAIASSAEEKLAEFNSTYDKYREETDRKLVESETLIASLERNRSDLEERLSKTIQEITELQEKLDMERMEASNEKLRFNDEITRLKNADIHAHENVQRLQRELNAQSNQLLQARTDYDRVIVAEAERIKISQQSEKDMAELRKTNSELHGRASSAEQQLAASQKSWESMQQKFKEELAALEKTNEDLTEQNKILHNQFESINSRLQALQDMRNAVAPFSSAAEGAEGVASSESEKNLADVIRYLRREKDILEKEREVAEQKIVRMQLQISQLQGSLDEARISLNEERQKSAEWVDSQRMHTELMAKMNQLDVLRESNATLRNQIKIDEAELTKLKSDLHQKNLEFNPIKEENMILKADVDSLKSEIKIISEDCERWKGRTQQILAKYERIDPVEHQHLKDRVANAESVRDTVTKEAEEYKRKVDELTTALSSVNQKLADLSSKSVEAQSQLASAQTALDRTKGSDEALKQSQEEVEKLKTEKAAVIQKANNISAKMREQIASLKDQIKTLMGEKLSWLQEKEDINKTHSETVAKLLADHQENLRQEKQRLDTYIASSGTAAATSQSSIQVPKVLVSEAGTSVSAPPSSPGRPGINRNVVPLSSSLSPKAIVPVTAQNEVVSPVQLPPTAALGTELSQQASPSAMDIVETTKLSTDEKNAHEPSDLEEPAAKRIRLDQPPASAPVEENKPKDTPSDPMVLSATTAQPTATLSAPAAATPVELETPTLQTPTATVDEPTGPIDAMDEDLPQTQIPPVPVSVTLPATPTPTPAVAATPVPVSAPSTPAQNTLAAVSAPVSVTPSAKSLNPAASAFTPTQNPPLKSVFATPAPPPGAATPPTSTPVRIQRATAPLTATPAPTAAPAQATPVAVPAQQVGSAATTPTPSSVFAKPVQSTPVPASVPAATPQPKPVDSDASKASATPASDDAAAKKELLQKKIAESASATPVQSSGASSDPAAPSEPVLNPKQELLKRKLAAITRTAAATPAASPAGTPAATPAATPVGTPVVTPAGAGGQGAPGTPGIAPGPRHATPAAGQGPAPPTPTQVPAAGGPGTPMPNRPPGVQLRRVSAGAAGVVVGGGQPSPTGTGPQQPGQGPVIGLQQRQILMNRGVATRQMIRPGQSQQQQQQQQPNNMGAGGGGGGGGQGGIGGANQGFSGNAMQRPPQQGIARGAGVQQGVFRGQSMIRGRGGVVRGRGMAPGGSAPSTPRPPNPAGQNPPPSA
ncbi:hypothetical protein HDU97_007492 [Phlyctochytrium planicorne]|nr:hypothetical protein HDU97_007492 [Phlyctochytrium planicorne]